MWECTAVRELREGGAQRPSSTLPRSRERPRGPVVETSYTRSGIAGLLCYALMSPPGKLSPNVSPKLFAPSARLCAAFFRGRGDGEEAAGAPARCAPLA